MRLKHYEEEELKEATKYFFRCKNCGQKLLLKEIWLKD